MSDNDSDDLTPSVSIDRAKRNHKKEKNHRPTNEEARHARIRRKAILSEDDEEDWKDYEDR